jgi:hypothetical protein
VDRILAKAPEHALVAIHDELDRGIVSEHRDDRITRARV